MDISNDIDIHPHKEFNLIQDFSSESKFERQNVIFWNNYGIETVNHYFLPKYIDENAFRIRSEYLERRNELIFKLFPNFEKTLINECILYGSSIIESNPFKEKIILNIIKVIALGLFYDENKVKSINCYLNKGEIISSLKLLCSSKGIKFKFEKIKIKEKKGI